MYFFWTNAQSSKGQLKYILMIALFFAWLGDIFLMFQLSHPQMFLFGLGAFLLTHIFYLFAFTRTNKNGQSVLIQHPYLILPFVGYALGLLYLIQDKLGDMLLPVVVYASVICLMALFAVKRYGKVNSQSFQLVLFGALLFMLSDSLIALNKFHQPIHWSALWILSTYCLGQYLIVKGILTQMQDYFIES